LDTYDFPQQILTDHWLSQALEDTRIDRIRNSIISQNCEDSIIGYRVPWFDSSIREKESVDLIYSQAVLEHVDDLQNAYRSMKLWLKPKGFISHQIDFRCHGMTDEWNGHWTYSDFMWKLIRGNRPYLLNREPHSTHIRILEEESFNIVCDKKIKSKSHITRNKLAQRFKDISDDDITTSGSFIQAIKQY
jgi:SAM-dependent methyltransferase